MISTYIFYLNIHTFTYTVYVYCYLIAIFFTRRVVKRWIRLTRQVVASPSLEIFKT